MTIPGSQPLGLIIIVGHIAVCKLCRIFSLRAHKCNWMRKKYYSIQSRVFINLHTRTYESTQGSLVCNLQPAAVEVPGGYCAWAKAETCHHRLYGRENGTPEKRAKTGAGAGAVRAGGAGQTSGCYYRIVLSPS